MNYKVRLLKYGKMSVETKVALTNTLALFQSKISLKDEKENEINMKSIIGMLSIELIYGRQYEIVIAGTDEEMAVAAMRQDFTIVDD